jgi:hypothetical protein
MWVIAGDRIKGPKLPPFEEKSDDIDSYLRRFERHAEAHNWHNTIWPTHLSAHLKRNAMDVYVLLPSEHALYYDVLKGCLLRRFDKTEDGFKQRFRAFRHANYELQHDVRISLDRNLCHLTSPQKEVA